MRTTTAATAPAAAHGTVAGACPDAAAAAGTEAGTDVGTDVGTEAGENADGQVTIRGFLLTRAWRDGPDGIELSLWAASARGPLRLLVSGQRAVCFVDRGTELVLPDGARRRELPLARLGGGAVDALYFRRHRDLQTIRHGAYRLCESDVKPVERFLMERFVRAGVEARGELERRSGYLQIRDPVLRPAELEPRLSVVSIDIETRGGSEELYSIAAARMVDGSAPHGAPGDAVVFMVGRGEPERREGYTLHYREREREVLTAFLDWLARIDPDVLSGWSVVNFDLDFLARRALALGVPFRLGRGGAIATVLPPGSAGSPRLARVPGRAVLDGIELIKATRVFESYSLEHVAGELLGSGKLITAEQDKLGEINRLFRDDKPRLADYNLRDCTLVNEILAHASLVDFAVRRASLTGLALDRLGGAAAAFDNLYLPRLHRRGHVAPDIERREEASGGPGGHVMDSVPGLHRDVLVLDFKSLYPSIIRTFFVDPLGMALGEGDERAVAGFLGARFAREGHILPGLIDELWAARDAAKATRDEPLSQAIKIIMNSFYGVFGTSACRFCSERLVTSITRRGHEIITGTRERVEAGGHRVIYGDTDSLFVMLGDGGGGSDGGGDGAGQARSALATRGAELVATLNAWWKTELRERHDLESRLELEYETHYERFLMPTVRGAATGSKKRYAGLVREAGGEPRLVVKGLEAVRTDWTPLARRFQRELLLRVFTDAPWEALIHETVARLRAGELDAELVYRKRLRRDASDYQRSMPAHVQAARKLARSGRGKPGRWIRYVMTRNGAEPAEALESAPDHDHYLERQLAPAADGVLRFLGTSFADVIDAQMSMF